MLALALATQLMLQSTTSAQTDQGRLVGTVRDQHNAVVPGATLSVKNERTGEARSVNSTEQGQYLLTALKPSFYTVTIKAAGFADGQYTNIQVSVGQEVTLDVELKPAGTTESVTVVGSEDPAIDTSSARLGTNVNQREVQDLPLNGRQLSQLYLSASRCIGVTSRSSHRPWGWPSRSPAKVAKVSESARFSSPATPQLDTAASRRFQ
jgi:hypothetical protein